VSDSEQAQLIQVELGELLRLGDGLRVDGERHVQQVIVRDAEDLRDQVGVEREQPEHRLAADGKGRGRSGHVGEDERVAREEGSADEAEDARRRGRVGGDEDARDVRLGRRLERRERRVDRCDLWDQMYARDQLGSILPHLCKPSA